MTLELTNRELDVLCELLDRRLTELKVEIHRTESTGYREALDEENEILTSLQKRMPTVTAHN